MVPLARRNLLADRGRLVMSVGGVAFAVVLVLIVISLYRGWSEFGSLYTRLPGNVWVSQRGTSDPFHSTSFIPESAGRALARIPGVVAVMPVYARHVEVGTSGGGYDVFLMAIGAPPGVALPANARRAYLPPPGHITIDNVLADATGLTRGGRLQILGRRLVVDDVRTGGTRVFQFAFLNPADARTLFASGDRVNFFLLSTRPGADPARIGRAAQAAVPGSEASTSSHFADVFSRSVRQGFLPVVGVLVAIGLIVGGAVIALTIYTATLERSRDYGVLKAVGASSLYLYRVVIVQSLTVGALGTAIGLAVSATAAPLIRRSVPEFVTDLQWSDAGLVFVAALVVAICAAAVPVRRINRIDPAEVFRA